MSEAPREVKLLLVGPYETDLDPLEKITQKRINTNPNIITTGFQADIRPYLVLSDTFVFPSYREGFPNVVLQAIAMEVPCIVSDINGCNEIIREGETGAIVPPKQTQPLVDKMVLFYHEKNVVQKFINTAKSEVATNYDRLQFWKSLLEEYKYQEQYVSRH